MRFLSALMPREARFFALFNQHAALVATGGRTVAELVRDYDDQSHRDAQILKRADGDGTGWLVVDDLVDTGTTGRLVREMLPKAHFATVYAKPAGRSVVDTFITEVSQDTWILFPWDTAPQYAKPIAAQAKPA